MSLSLVRPTSSRTGRVGSADDVLVPRPRLSLRRAIMAVIVPAFAEPGADMTAYARAPRDVAAEAAESLTRYLHGDEVVTATDDGLLILRLRHEDRGARPIRLQEMAYHAIEAFDRLGFHTGVLDLGVGWAPITRKRDPEAALEYADAAARESVRQRDLQPLGHQRRGESLALDRPVVVQPPGAARHGRQRAAPVPLPRGRLRPGRRPVLAAVLGSGRCPRRHRDADLERVLPGARAAPAAGRACRAGTPRDGRDRGVPAQRGRHHRGDPRGVPAPGVLRRPPGRARLQHARADGDRAAAAADGAEPPRPRRDPRRGLHLEGAERQRRAARRGGGVRRHLRRRPPPDAGRLRPRLALAGRRRRRRPGPLRDPQRLRELADAPGRRRVRADLRGRPPRSRRAARLRHLRRLQRLLARRCARAGAAARLLPHRGHRGLDAGAAGRGPDRQRPGPGQPRAGTRVVEGPLAPADALGTRAGSRCPADTSARR